MEKQIKTPNFEAERRRLRLKLLELHLGDPLQRDGGLVYELIPRKKSKRFISEFVTLLLAVFQDKERYDNIGFEIDMDNYKTYLIVRQSK